MSALGLIETKGLIAAIESADAMLKAANVCLLERTQVGAGLVTITIAGEVAAVKASIDAAAAAVKRIEGAKIVSQHVIPRPDAEVDHIILTKIKDIEPENSQTKTVVEEDKAADTDRDDHSSKELEEKSETADLKEKIEEEISETDVSKKPEVKKGYEDSQLKKMNLSKLRAIARDLENLDLGGKEINSARKKELIEAIINAYRKKEE